MTGYVLGSFTPDEQSELDQVIQDAATACDLIVAKGVVQAMNQMNARR